MTDTIARAIQEASAAYNKPGEEPAFPPYMEDAVNAAVEVIRGALMSDEVMMAIRDSGLQFETDRGTQFVTSPEHAMNAALRAAGLAEVS